MMLVNVVCWYIYCSCMMLVSVRCCPAPTGYSCALQVVVLSIPGGWCDVGGGWNVG